jgi:hypothetical protein
MEALRIVSDSWPIALSFCAFLAALLLWRVVTFRERVAEIKANNIDARDVTIYRATDG